MNFITNVLIQDKGKICVCMQGSVRMLLHVAMNSACIVHALSMHCPAQSKSELLVLECKNRESKFGR